MENYESGSETGPTGREGESEPKHVRIDISHVMRVKEAYEDQLLKLPNVVGVGIGFRAVEGRQTGELALIVPVRKKVPSSGLSQEATIPKELEGVPVDVQEVGDVSAY